MAPLIEHKPLAAASYMSLAMLMGAGIDISAKTLTSDFTTAQIVLLRSAFALPIVLVICRYQGGLRALATPRWGWQVYRGFLTAGANFGFFYGLAFIPIVNALLLAYISPVLIVILSRPLLGESVGLNRWLGILVAFGGVLTVLQPTQFDIPPAAYAIFGSALCWALLSISNRKLAGIEPPGVLTFYALPVSGLLAGILTVGQWQTPVGVDWVFFTIMGICGATAHLFAAIAYRHAPAAVVAPFEYTALIWVALAGYLFWQEQPDVWTWIGGAAVILGGYLSLQSRE